MENRTELKLPPLPSGEPLQLPEDARHLTIIGANGSGKTRFTEHLRRGMGDRAYMLSALDAFAIGERRNDSHNGIDTLYGKATEEGRLLHNRSESTFERLFAMLLNEEMERLVAFKLAHARGENPPLEQTKLDAVIGHWQELFPQSHVLREGGNLLFGRTGDSDAIGSHRLSQGERAVLFYLGAILFAPISAIVFVENPAIFLHPSLLRPLWDTLEEMRPDCRFIYTTHDIPFAASRSDNTILWVRSYDPDSVTWDYSLLPSHEGLSEELTMALVGARRPVLFIEGDESHSIDCRLYPLIFPEYTVKPLGSCSKVIEATRAFNSLRGFHQLDSRGIVDRDRRDEHEVEYLRGKGIYVPEVAEIENILMLEEVVGAVAAFHGKDPKRVVASVKRSVINQFKHDLRQQALLHTRHRVKRTVEMRVDGRFTNINLLEEHLRNLGKEINPRALYEKMCREFSGYVQENDYRSILRVYNQKSMVPNSNVGSMCGLGSSKESYAAAVIAVLRTPTPQADSIREAIKKCFRF